MRYLYYCNSAYQLLTILNLNWHRKHASFENITDYHADLIILGSFSCSKDIYEIIKNKQDFDDVKLIEKKYNKGSFHAIQTALDLISPAHFLKDKYGFNKNDYYNKYDVLTAPKYSTVMGAIWRLNKKARLHLIEDGLGTYYLKADFLIPQKGFYSFAYKKHLLKDFTNFDALYLNDTSFYTGLWKKPVINIPKYNNDYLKEVKNYFKDFSSVYNEDDKDIYYLAQTLENDDAIKTTEAILDSLKQYKERIIYCPHPRWPETEKKDFDYSPDKQIWEMKLLDMDNVEDKLFISIHSTACLTPKLLFNKEPYLILYYPMIADEVIDSDDQFYKTMNLFYQQYKDQRKIMLPKNIEEFNECLKWYVSQR